MSTWYLGKIQHQQEQENGSLKTVSEAYLIDAVSYTEAEARLYGIVADNTPDFKITSLAPMKLSDVFRYDDGEKWFKVKTFYVSIDEKKNTEKKIVCNMLVNANSPKQAIEHIEQSLSTMLVPYEITDVNLTPILEVHEYVEEKSLLEQLKEAGGKPIELPEGFKSLSQLLQEQRDNRTVFRGIGGAPTVALLNSDCPCKEANSECMGQCAHEPPIVSRSELNLAHL